MSFFQISESLGTQNVDKDIKYFQSRAKHQNVFVLGKKIIRKVFLLCIVITLPYLVCKR